MAPTTTYPVSAAVHRSRARQPISSRPIATHEWTVHVRSLPDQTLAATLQGARMFFLITIAATVSLLALVLTVRATAPASRSPR
jgi:hypothetical protein